MSGPGKPEQEVRSLDELPMDLAKRRQGASAEIADARAMFDLADLSDQEFERELDRMKTRLERIDRIIKTRLVEGVHYGIPKDKNGNPIKSIKKPFLYQPGAEELRSIYRLRLKSTATPIIEASKEYVSVTVTIGVFDSFGRLLAERSANCNSQEGRFEKWDKSGRIFTDAREVIHNCLSMAEKRAGVFATREATGASGNFSNPEEMEKALEEASAETGEAIEGWTEEEKTKIYRLTPKAGIKTREEFATFVLKTLGHEHISTGGDVEKLELELNRRIDAKRSPLAGAGKDDLFEEAQK